MTTTVRSIVFGLHAEHYWMSLLLFLGVALGVILGTKQLSIQQHEGFEQDVPYLYVSDVYADPVYVSMYDRLMTPPDVLENVVAEVVRMTHPSPQTSSMLDLGTGTALTAATLAKRGYMVFAVDESPVMIDHAKTRHGNIPTLHLKQASFLEPMLWESGSFSHILCTGFTLYTLDSAAKRRLFENCLHWLKPGGHLIVHAVEADKFETIIPGGRPPVPIRSEERVTNTLIDFVDFEYRASYTFPEPQTMKLRETFVDKSKVRELEHIFHVVPVQEVVTTAVRAGFSGQGYAALAHDPHQYLYVFVK